MVGCLGDLRGVYIYLEGSYHGIDAALGKINRDEGSSGGRNKKKKMERNGSCAGREEEG